MNIKMERRTDRTAAADGGNRSVEKSVCLCNFVKQDRDSGMRESEKEASSKQKQNEE
jgi:hypothetical protein